MSLFSRLFSRLSSLGPATHMLLEHSSLLGGKRIVLASQSPRRKELLAQLGIQKFDVHVSTFNEMLDKKQFKNGAEYVSFRP